MWIDTNEIFIKLLEESDNSQKSTMIKKLIGGALKEKENFGVSETTSFSERKKIQNEI